MQDGESIFSLLVVWVVRFSNKERWYYEACPKCRKRIDSEVARCKHCSAEVEKTTLCFAMGVEVADSWGSIWMNMYDEFAFKVFSDMGNTVINQLREIKTEDARREKLEKYLYQEFKLKIITKKDEEGRIFHRALKLWDTSPDKEAIDNLKKIGELI
jgi:hypothetical protein